MNYALDALWQHLHHPRIRTLAALLTAPPPWRSGREIPVSLLLGSRGFRLLEQWDRQPESQPQALQIANEQQALGRYAESLLAAWFAHAPLSRLIAANHPVSLPNSRQQSGAFDFIVELDGRLCHIELCCKYYSGSGQPESMVGLNPQDRLTDKTAKILQQSSLSATPAGSSSLKTLGFTESAVRRYTLIRGNLFTPDGTLPAHPLYQPQSWCGLLNPDIGALPQPPQTRFYRLPRCEYPAPARIDSSLNGWHGTPDRNGIYAAMQRQADGNWHETFRFMVTNQLDNH